MALPIQLIVGFIVGAIAYKFIGKQLDEIVVGIIKPKQSKQTPPPVNEIKCPHCNVMVKKKEYLDHLYMIHNINVEKWYEEMTGVKSG